MSTQTYMTSAVLLPWSKLAWLEENNERPGTNYGDLDEIRNSLAAQGWVIDNPVPAVHEPGTPGALTPEQIAKYMAGLESEWNRLKANVAASDSAANLAELHVFETLHCVKDGDALKLDTPEFSPNAGFRRHRAYRSAMVLRYSNPKSVTDKDVRTMIPIRIAVYKNEPERIVDQQRENEMQLRGAKKMDDLDKLRVTRRLFDNGCIENYIRKELYPSSTAQKTFGICQANANWPSLDIYTRFLLPGDDASGKRIPWGPVRGAELLRFNNMFEADRKRREGLPLSKDERALEPFKDQAGFGAADVEEYFQGKIREAAEGPAVKMMTKPDIAGHAKNHPLLAVKSAMDNVINNTEPNALKTAKEFAAPLNYAWEMVQSNKGTALDTILIAVKTHEAQMVEFAKLLTSGEAFTIVKGQPTPPPAPPAPEAPPATKAKKGK